MSHWLGGLLSLFDLIAVICVAHCVLFRSFFHFFFFEFLNFQKKRKRPAVEEEEDLVISTPKLISVQTLNPTQNSVNSALDLGGDSEMSKARRVEAAVAFWRNQSSFHLSPERKLRDLVDLTAENMPAEFRRMLAEGVQHNSKGSMRGRRMSTRRRGGEIFSEDEDVEEHLANSSANTTGSISWSKSEGDKE